MASAYGFYSLASLGWTYTLSSTRYRMLTIQSCSRIPIAASNNQNSVFIAANPSKISKIRDSRVFNSVELDRFLTSNDEDEMGEGFFEAIEELERMTREPSDVLEEMNERLSARELQLVLVYFSQEGRDSWCALEVFEWLKKENRVDKETMELMVSLMCDWVKKLIEGKKEVAEVVDLLVDMDCVGLKPGFSMIEKVISLYWDYEKKDMAVCFVEEILKRGIVSSDDAQRKGGPVGYLAWKMMTAGDYRGAVNFVVQHKGGEVYSYLIGMTAVVKELNEFAKALRKLKGFNKAGIIAELNQQNIDLIEQYKSDLLASGLHLSKLVLQEGSPSLEGMVHERLLAMYICAGRGLLAEKQLWEMKISGKEADSDLYDIVLAICASQQETTAIGRLMSRMEVTSYLGKKKSLSWLLRGYLKGGHFLEAADTVMKMIDSGLNPEFLDRAAVLQEMRKRINQAGYSDKYLKLCKRLSDANLTGPCLVYTYIKKHKLWIIKTL
ncbi:pentatricopeptide repeat-containing protein At2g30100, chloroplastic [Impatiens glandulifera]|uniref:pentatricopeptide repeat-containing protein At2g30100, chloroplastic n=1 Tax=Impatiens glandulifera TaxID=253017 RepID=UPI001FB0B62B|nr:pentatricopeptide repeat-containing protein At2g30100, chloroplastic [Impatiens glandulifera]